MSDEEQTKNPYFYQNPLDKVGEDGLTGRQRGLTQSKVIREVKKDIANTARRRTAELTKQAIKAFEVRVTEEEIDVLSGKVEVPDRNVKQMQAFAYTIINRELSRLDRVSKIGPLSGLKIKNLTALMSMLNTTAKTDKTVNDEDDVPGQRPDESLEAYTRRLEDAANG